MHKCDRGGVRPVFSLPVLEEARCCRAARRPAKMGAMELGLLRVAQMGLVSSCVCAVWPVGMAGGFVVGGGGALLVQPWRVVGFRRGRMNGYQIRMDTILSLCIRAGRQIPWLRSWFSVGGTDSDGWRRRGSKQICSGIPVLTYI